MKTCPNCNKTYMDYDQYCLVCRRKLKYIEGSKKVEYCPESHDSSYIKTTETKPTPHCPTCQSTNIKKISATSKAVSVGLFGIFSQKVKRQFKCNNCGYEW